MDFYLRSELRNSSWHSCRGALALPTLCFPGNIVQRYSICRIKVMCIQLLDTPICSHSEMPIKRSLITMISSLLAWVIMFAAPDSPGNPVSENSIARKHIILNDGWLVKQIDQRQPDVAALERESSIPDRSWLSARMPAQVHDILQAHHLISDPHVGTNSAASAWIGEKDWAYVCRFPTPKQTGDQARLR